MSVDESLNHYEAVARYYDAENASKIDDLPLYDALAAEVGGPILDVGSGTARLLIHLAEQGYTVTGIEPSPPMFTRAQRKVAQQSSVIQERITMHQTDIMGYEPTGRFELITVSFHAFMHLRTQEEQIAALECFREWLTEDGLLVIDLPNVGHLYSTPDNGSLILEQTFVEPESGRTVMQYSVTELDRAAQRIYITWIYDELAEDGTVKRTVAPLSMRCFFPAEMALLLRAAGLDLDTMYGDYEMGPFEDGCPLMTVIAQRDVGV